MKALQKRADEAIVADASLWDALIDRHLGRQTVERGLSRNSLEAYGTDLRDFQTFCAKSGIEPPNLDTLGLTAWLEHLADRGFKVTSQRRHLAAVRGLIRDLIDEKILASDPAEPLGLRPHPRALPRTLSRKDIDNLIAAIEVDTLRGRRDRAMLEMAYGCGLGAARAQEIPRGAACGRDDTRRGQKSRDANWIGSQTEFRQAECERVHQPIGSRDDPAGIFQGAQRMDGEKSAAGMDQSTYLAALLRDSSSGRRRRSQSRTRDARSQRHLDDPDLYPFDAVPSAQSPSDLSPTCYASSTGDARPSRRSSNRELTRIKIVRYPPFSDATTGLGRPGNRRDYPA